VRSAAPQTGAPLTAPGRCRATHPDKREGASGPRLFERRTIEVQVTAAQPETAQAFPALPAPPAGISSLGTSAYLLQNSRLGFPAQVPIWEPAFPFGNQQNPLGLRADVRQTHVRSRCTGKERDAETGLDYFLARYYSGAQGRFTTPDWSKTPEGVPYADLSNPQSLNLYTYVRNNPLRTADPDGHCSGDDCSEITVTAEVHQQPTVRVDPPSGGKQTATAEGEVRYQVKYDGKPMADTPIHEDVANKTSKDGQSMGPVQTETRDAKTNAQGVVADQTSISITVPAMPGLAKSTLSTSVFTKETNQVLTMTSPAGAACSVTEKRTMTNADSSGDADVYKITLQTPKVTATPAKGPPQPKQQ